MLYQPDLHSFHLQPGQLSPSPSIRSLHLFLWPLAYLSQLQPVFSACIFPQFLLHWQPMCCHLMVELAGARGMANEAQGGIANWHGACRFPSVSASATRQMLPHAQLHEAGRAVPNCPEQTVWCIHVLSNFPLAFLAGCCLLSLLCLLG